MLDIKRSIHTNVYGIMYLENVRPTGSILPPILVGHPTGYIDKNMPMRTAHSLSIDPVGGSTNIGSSIPRDLLSANHSTVYRSRD